MFKIVEWSATITNVVLLLNVLKFQREIFWLNKHKTLVAFTRKLFRFGGGKQGMYTIKVI